MAEAACLCLGQLRHMEVWLLSVQKGAVVMTVKIKECVCVRFTACQNIANHLHFIPCLC